MKKKYYHQLISLPSILIEDLKNLTLSQSEFNHSLLFINNLKKKSYRNFGFYDMQVDVPKLYLTKAYSNHYSSWLNKLKESNIVTVVLDSKGKERYSKRNSKCKTYNINSKYFNRDTKYSNIDTMCPHLNQNQSEQEFQSLKEKVKNDLKQLEFNFEFLREAANKKISTINIKNFKTNEQIKAHFFQVIIKKGDSKRTYNMTIESALRIAQEENLTLIQDKKKYYITDAASFIETKINVYTEAYIGSIDRIEKQYWYAERNSTNNRLDTNITNLCSELMDIIIEQNDLVQFDLANSQFAILCHILKKTDIIKDKSDFKRFMELCVSGELYDRMKEELSLETRKEAKIMLFELLFSSERNKSDNKKKLVKLFPSVIEWIDNFKRQNGYEQFPIMLQKEEASIFIDDIWNHFKELDKFCLTKHDSIIVKREDAAMAEEFLKQYFESIDFIAKIVSSDKKSVILQ